MSTALKRLMTEYKQLTANEDEDSMFTAGIISLSYYIILHLLTTLTKQVQ